MYLYNYTISPATLPLKSIVGLFVGGKSQQLVCATSSGITVYNLNEGNLEKISSQMSFGIIQNIGKLNPFGDKDYLVITSDSGNLVVAEFKNSTFKAIIQEPYGKNGLRRINPGEYLDITDTAILITAIDQKKFVYRVHKTDDGIELSSPLISNSKVTVNTCALDTGFENPIFASIEINNGFQLTHYELDRGLNHIIKRSQELPESANLLIPLIGGGLIIACDGFLLFNNERFDTGHIFINYVVHKSFILVQNTKGELYKITMPFKMDYFSKVPIAKDLNLFKKGFLFVNSISSNKLLYQIEDLDGKISPLDEIKSFEPILDLQSNEDKLKILSIKGLSTLVHGIDVEVLVSSPIPIQPISVESTKLTRDSVNDEYLVISSTSETLILSIGEVVEEVTDSNFVFNQSTIKVQQVGSRGILQVYSNGIRHIVDKKIVKDWYPPAGINILKADTNNNQIMVGLSNNEVVYFEIENDTLVEYPQHLELGQITAIGLSEKFAIVGVLDTIQVVSLQDHNRLETVSFQQLSANSTSIILENDNVHIGMENGLYVNTTMTNGKLTNTKLKYLGSKPVILSIIGDHLLGVSSKTWLIADKITPLNISLTCGTSFISEDIGGEGIVGCNGQELIIFSIGEHTDMTVTDKVDLKSSRKLVENYILQSNGVKNGVKFLEIPNPISLCKFNNHLIVGSHEYLYAIETNSFEILHQTRVDKTPQAMVPFNDDQLLVGMENHLRIYELGQKQLLRKSSTTFPFINRIVKLLNQGNKRIVIGDSKNSVTFAKYNKDTNLFEALANDTFKRQITSLESLDFDTVVGGDKFGNIFVNRFINGENLPSQESYLNGAGSRLQNLCEFYLNDIPTSLTKATLTLGGSESIVYGGIEGTIGIMTPLSKQEFDLMNNLEIELRKEDNLLGKNQLVFRSYYNPKKNVIDGDFVDIFHKTNVTSKIRISKTLNKSIKDIENKIYEIRQRSAF